MSRLDDALPASFLETWSSRRMREIAHGLPRSGQSRPCSPYSYAFMASEAWLHSPQLEPTYMAPLAASLRNRICHQAAVGEVTRSGDSRRTRCPRRNPIPTGL